MAKRKRRQKTRIPPLKVPGSTQPVRGPGPLGDQLARIPNTSNPTDSCTQRLSNLAMELTLAGGQVLRESFDFDENQVNEWLDKTIVRAKQNRNG